MTLEETIEQMMRMLESEDLAIALKPTHLLVQPYLMKAARSIVFPHHILKRRKGVRGRAMTLKWRRKLNRGGKA